DRRDPDPHRPEGPRRARPTQLPAGRQDLRPGPGRGAAAPPRLAWGVELHRPPRRRIATPRIKFVVRGPLTGPALPFQDDARFTAAPRLRISRADGRAGR